MTVAPAYTRSLRRQRRGRLGGAGGDRSCGAEGVLIVVQKYGGSSMTDVACIHAVAHRVVQTQREGSQVVVVVSAMGNTTNELLELARSVSSNPGRRELDLLVSVGERVSMTLLAMAIQDLGVPASSFTGSQSGIITDDEHVNARVVEVRPGRIQAALARGDVAIVAGFQGMSRSKEVTTLGRGGSDTTAIVLAAALGADHCEICSDVDGVYTGDPRVVDEAVRHQRLSLDGALSLCEGGAKVLQAEAVRRAKALGVRLEVSSTEKPSGSGTLLEPHAPIEPVVGVAARGGLRLVTLPDDAMGEEPLAGVWAAWGSIGCVGALLEAEVGGGPASLPVGTEDRGEVVAVTCVGARLGPANAWLSQALQAVADRSVHEWWCRANVLTLAVAPQDAVAVQQALHGALIRDAD